jgi:hypothetical protein
VAVLSVTVRLNSVRTLRSALVEVLSSPGRIVGFTATAVGVTLLYSILLPFDYTEHFELANWQYLNTYLIAWAIILGVGMSLVVSIQVYAMRRIAVTKAAGGSVGGIAFITSLLPSFLCCTPIISTLLAFVGVSGMSLYSTTGVLQHFFATHQSEFLVASVVLLVLTAWRGLHKVATASCLSGNSCDIEPFHLETLRAAYNDSHPTTEEIEEEALR